MNVLFVGCHCDDIELGCGGIIKKFSRKWKIQCHVLSHTDLSGRDLKRVCKKSMKKIGVENVTFSTFRPSFFSEERQKIWETLSEVEKIFQPDLVFCNENDEHQDHKVACDEVLRNFRKSSVIQYNIPRSSGSFVPNIFVELSETEVRAKCEAIVEYKKINSKNYLSKKSIVSQLRFFGIHPEMEYCESFNAKRIMSRKHSSFNF